jgi:hypothetical protein
MVAKVCAGRHVTRRRVPELATILIDVALA